MKGSLWALIWTLHAEKPWQHRAAESWEDCKCIQPNTFTSTSSALPAERMKVWLTSRKIWGREIIKHVLPFPITVTGLPISGQCVFFLVKTHLAICLTIEIVHRKAIGEVGNIRFLAERRSFNWLHGLVCIQTLNKEIGRSKVDYTHIEHEMIFKYFALIPVSLKSEVTYFNYSWQ